MDALDLKERIINDDKIIDVLEALGMHHINPNNSKYITCGMPDGDRINSTVIYTDNLHVDAYTRNIIDPYGGSDIISLVSFINGTYITESIKWLCDVCEYDYYGQEIKKSKFAEWIRDMWKVSQESKDEDSEKLKPLDERILNYYGNYVNDLFEKDGISYETQIEFELGYDLFYHMVTIPIRDELNFLVGVKGRLFKEKVNDDENKYLYLHSCAKSKVLFGLNKTKQYIKERQEVIVVESEKAVMQLWTLGIKNAVAIGGHILSPTQVKKLTYLNVPIVIAYDQGAEIGKDGKVDKTFYPNEFNKFLENQTVYCLYDKAGKILNEKESPSDNPLKWEALYKNKFKVRG
ncbi:toprim domain-containing protein [Heyndrickxia camelliae]|uniref:DNA primase n=1 Tax=Heyndrickxia camelliae TaxID=1707093 RepID=A0A2N3LG33_9BACI|nr:toprim domain-containing protein [Heyndrickxia camelliae]PKR83525.1 DNA primase [Heyndrickxia camelliae]